MTAEERKMVFVHAVVCSIYNDLNWVLGFFREHGGTPVKGLEGIAPLVSDAYDAVEKAHTALDKRVSQHTTWDDAKEE